MYFITDFFLKKYKNRLENFGAIDLFCRSPGDAVASY